MRNIAEVGIDYYFLETSLKHSDLPKDEAEERIHHYLLASRITEKEATTLIKIYLS